MHAIEITSMNLMEWSELKEIDNDQLISIGNFSNFGHVKYNS